HQRGEIEGRAQPRLLAVEQKAKPLVRLLRSPKAGELPHRPQPPPVHTRMDAALVRVLARVSELRSVVEITEIVGSIKRLYRRAADRRRTGLLWSRVEHLLVPSLPWLVFAASIHVSPSGLQNQVTLAPLDRSR